MAASERIIKIISTFFYLGYLPLAPGTFASLAGIFIFYLVGRNSVLYLSVVCLVLVLGFRVSSRAEIIFGRKDAQCIVIDEVAGMLLSFMFMPYPRTLFIISGFIIFRVLDILKPYPINAVQKIKGSPGIMFDDLMAALYTNLILQLALRWISFKGS